MIPKKMVLTTILAMIVFSGLPFIVDSESSYLVFFLFVTFINITIVQGWNLVGGYAGQVSLGQHAFFGLGAYITAITWLRGLTGYFDPLAMILSGFGAAILAIGVGIPLLSKLRGDYFALGTLGLGEILRVIFTQGGTLTGGSVGLLLPSRVYESMKPYYFISLGLAAFATIAIYYIVRSRIGKALIATRDDEVAAEASGIYTLKYKVLAFSVGAFLTGLGGSLQAYYLFHIHPAGFFNLKWALYPILMSIMGGAGTILGPVIGAFFLTGVFELVNIWLPEGHPIFSGGLIVAVMLFLPNGLIRLRLKRIIGKKGEKKGGEIKD
jgi:branched-chain amino acid transport system permease protein